MRSLAVVILLLFLAYASGNTCNFFENLPEELASNPKFWEDVNTARSRGPITTQDLNAIAQKHGQNLPGTVSAAPAPTPVPASFLMQPVSTARYSISEQAFRSARSLPASAMRRLDEFVAEIQEGGNDFLSRLREKQSYWRLERISEVTGGLSVRIGGGERILFRMGSQGLVEILNVGKAVYRH